MAARYLAGAANRCVAVVSADPRDDGSAAASQGSKWASRVQEGKEDDAVRSEPVRRPRRRVALLVQTASDWSRQVLRGVANYAHEHGEWDFYIEPRGFYERLRLPSGWKGDGVIARLGDPALRRAVRRAGLPAVNVSWLGRHTRDLPKVVSDEGGCGRLAAKHLLDKAFTSFGYVGAAREIGYFEVLGQEFERLVAEAGGYTSRFTPSRCDDEAELVKQQAAMANWLSKLPKPTGLLVWSSETGRAVTAACATVRLRVPEDVAVLCAEHDSLMSSLAPVPLSNLDQAPARVGYEAAALLDRMIEGAPGPAEPMLIPPIGVVQRQSTDTTAVSDPLVSGALRFIREHAAEPIQVIDLLRAMHVSRRKLEHQFMRVLGTTPAAEIRNARIERTKRLLVESDLPISAIARQAGFNHTEVLIRTFRREVGMPPGEFRRMR